MRINGVGTFVIGQSGSIRYIEMNNQNWAIAYSEEEFEAEWKKVEEAKAFFDSLDDSDLSTALKKYTAIMIEAGEDELVANCPLNDENKGWNLKDMVIEAEALYKKMERCKEDYYPKTIKKTREFIKVYKPMVEGKRASFKHH